MKSKVRILLLVSAMLFLCACSPSRTEEKVPYIDLSDQQPLPTPEQNNIRPLRVAIAAVISPQGSVESYTPLLNYLEQELDRPIERIQRGTYSEINDLVRTGEVDMAFVCTSSYLVGKNQFDMQLLVAPQVDGKKVYHAKVIVPIDSQVENFRDLQGSVFAFTDPISFTGRMYPTYLIQQAGETPEQFFGRTFFTYSHDDAIYAVANGLADGASVDSLVLGFTLKRDPSLAEKIRVIHTSPPYGMPPVVTGPNVRPQMRAEFVNILLNVHLDPQGKDALQALDYDRFVQVSEEDYHSAEKVESAIECCEPVEK